VNWLETERLSHVPVLNEFSPKREMGVEIRSCSGLYESVADLADSWKNWVMSSHSQVKSNSSPILEASSLIELTTSIPLISSQFEIMCSHSQIKSNSSSIFETKSIGLPTASC
jgi:hypothetical protein